MEYAKQIVESLRRTETNGFIAPPIKELGKRNTAAVMVRVIESRLAASGDTPEKQKNSRYHWQNGAFVLRCSRVGNAMWTNLTQSQIDDLHALAGELPTVYCFCYFQLDEKKFHVWSVPEAEAYSSVVSIPVDKSGFRTILIYPNINRFHKSPTSADLTPYYAEFELTDKEVDALEAASKQDEANKTTDAVDEEESVEDPEVHAIGYTNETVDFLSALPSHTHDAEWHAAQKAVFQRALRKPTVQFVEQLRSGVIADHSAEVADGKRLISSLKKNDYGQGGYYDHYWFAFYAPDAPSRTKSCQLFFVFLPALGKYRYGFSFGFGTECEKYIQNLHLAIRENQASVHAYLLTAPEKTIAQIGTDTSPQIPLTQTLASIVGSKDPVQLHLCREEPLLSLIDNVDTLVDDVSEFFRWAWPFFDACVTGKWTGAKEDEEQESGDEAFDEPDGPMTLEQLSAATSLPLAQLRDIEEALLTKQQIILVGPPGTSKTYIAQQFARYFSRAKAHQPAGLASTLYMHANWAYEDFFEGIKPFTKDGALQFEPREGFFLDWVRRLPPALQHMRHVLVLDEINRCDTAAVLGELLQLLEYRGREVRLLSGRNFKFPSNVFIIGTMNSADRSIGRIDLALQRRFLWLSLHPQPEVLRAWLAKPGNNPVGFNADSLNAANLLLQDAGIPPEQQIGHALFMTQTYGSDALEPVDKPLVAELLRRIVRFSVLPYVHELCLMQFGQVDKKLSDAIGSLLLECLTGSATSKDDGVA